MTQTYTNYIKPYCGICAKDEKLKDMRTTHKETEHKIFFEILTQIGGDKYDNRGKD